MHHRRYVEIHLRIDTNMSPSELGDLAEGLLINVGEFGKEGIKDSERYERVICEPMDSYFVLVR